MTIALVQQSSVGTMSGSLSGTASLSGVTAGNALICLATHIASDATNPTFSVVDSQTGTPNYTQDVLVRQASNSAAMCTSLFSALAGSHTVTVTALAGAAGNSFGKLILLEISGITTFDKFGTLALTGTAAVTSSTGTLSAANEILFAVLGAQSALTGFTTPPTGGPGVFTNLFSDPSTFDSNMNYQIQTTGTAAVTANWGTLNSSAALAGLVATYYKPAVVTPLPYTPYSPTQFFVNENVIQLPGRNR